MPATVCSRIVRMSRAHVATHACFGARDVIAAGKAPCARVGHAMCAAPAGCGATGVKDDDRTLLIFGGGDGTRGFGDLLSLTLPREGAPLLPGQSVRLAHLLLDQQARHMFVADGDCALAITATSTADRLLP